MPDHGIDYSALNTHIKELSNSKSPLWKLDSSQLLLETNDHEIHNVEDDFGSLYIKTDNVEIECITQYPPKILFENRGLEELIQNLLRPPE